MVCICRGRRLGRWRIYRYVGLYVCIPPTALFSRNTSFFFTVPVRHTQFIISPAAASRLVSSRYQAFVVHIYHRPRGISTLINKKVLPTSASALITECFIVVLSISLFCAVYGGRGGGDGDAAWKEVENVALISHFSLSPHFLDLHNTTGFSIFMHKFHSKEPVMLEKHLMKDLQCFLWLIIILFFLFSILLRFPLTKEHLRENLQGYKVHRLPLVVLSLFDTFFYFLGSILRSSSLLFCHVRKEDMEALAVNEFLRKGERLCFMVHLLPPSLVPPIYLTLFNISISLYGSQYYMGGVDDRTITTTI